MRPARHWITVGAAVLAVLAPAPPAQAQAAPRTEPASTRPSLPPDEVVWVTAESGQEFQGRIASSSESAIRVIGRDGELALAWNDVALLEADVQDPVGNGVRNGGLIGGLSAAGFAGFVVALVCSIEGCDASDVSRFALLWSGFGAGVGAATGALVDLARPTRQVVYPVRTQTTVGDVRLGERVWVSTRDGRLLQGRLLDTSPTVLALAAAGTRFVVALDEVGSIAVERSDSLGNGIRNGILGGAGAMAGMLLIGQARSGSCCEPLTTVYWTAVGGGVGALAGAGVDALLRSREVAFRPAGDSASLFLAPVVEHRGVGVRFSLQW